jgi:hypothetical protein
MSSSASLLINIEEVIFMGRKITVGFLTFLLVISSFVALIGDFTVGTASARQSGDYTYTVSFDGKANITRYIGNGGEVTIPSMIDGYNVVAIGDNAFDDCYSVSSVIIPNGVISIGKEEFYNCPLRSIVIPESVKVIGSSAFFCSELTSITIPKSVTTIGNGAFTGCVFLTSIDVNAANSYYASVDGILYDRSITSLIQYPLGRSGSFEIPSGVTTIGRSAFDGCENLTSVTIPQSVTSIGDYSFAFCPSLTSITFNGNAPSVGRNWVEIYREGQFQAENLTVYYYMGASGFSTPWNGVPAIPLSSAPDSATSGVLNVSTSTISTIELVVIAIAMVITTIIAIAIYMRRRGK